ncbi:hypothetical protein HPULCUR_011820 [Helicostylum pulchrum]|uniref:Uncharacterized protein n=1 Tax=Helicostylum pulchrum TaxID=562976 RepID=A0ABP9YH54_9FUNG
MLEDKTDDGHYYEDGRKYNPTVRYVLPSDKGGPFRSIRPLLAAVCKEWEDKDVYDRFLEALTKELVEYKSYVKFYSAYAQKS